MTQSRAFWSCSFAAVATIVGGCGRSVPMVENPAPISSASYDQVFDAAVHTLRDMRFVVDRQDRRFGVVTSRSLIASSFFEPWYADNSTGEQVLESTLNMQRRTVRVHLEPPAEDDAASTSAGGAYGLRVQVFIERRYVPPQQLHTSAFGALSFRRSAIRQRPLTTEVGVQAAYWQDIGRDAFLEQRLVADILRRAAPASSEQPAETSSGG